jgi:hypothetical protein
MSVPLLPELAATGFATIYLTLPAGSFLHEWNKARTGLSAVKDPAGKPPQLLCILGQPSLAARLELMDFRNLVRAGYPSADSSAIVANTVFSTPYVTASRPLTPSDNGVFSFVTHMRARRSVYSIDPVRAESLIVERLRTLTDVEGANVSIEAGIGWADFVVAGTMQVEQFARFLEWLVDFNRMEIDASVGDTGYVFKRTLTLIGYPWLTDTQTAPRIEKLPENTKVLLFIRAERGRLTEVKRALEALPLTQAPAPPCGSIDVGFVDGKLDVVGIWSNPCSDFLERHQDLVLNAKKYSIERVETHLMFPSADEKETKPPVPVDCKCTGVARGIEAFVKSQRLDVLPEGTATAIRNLSFLSSSTCEEEASCCDARPAVIACWRSVRKMVNVVRKLQAVIKDPQTAPEERLKKHSVIRRVVQRIDLWLLSADRVLRQRTVGSFEEFLGQSDRALSYGGGVQKGLLLSDSLMNDFYSKMTGREPEFRFASVYDSVDRIMSIVKTSIVRIPVAKAFHLPGSLPDLWHEVGCYEFFRTLPPPMFTRGNNMNASWYRDLADHYGDLVSLVYGFELDFYSFASALVHGWKESVAKGEPEESKEWRFIQLLTRLVAALDFYIEEQSPLRTSGKHNAVLFTSFIRMKAFALKYLGKNFVPTSLFDHGVLALRPLRAGFARQHHQVLRQSVRAGNLRAMKQASSAVPIRNFTPSAPAPLIHFTPTDDLNSHYRQLYQAIERSRHPQSLRAPNAHGPMAAFARSATIEYYRRMTRRT